MDRLETVSAAQKERVRFIDYHSLLSGKIVRKDLQDKFGIAEAAATRDFSLYNKTAPQNLIYQPSIRAYVISEKFTPIFDYPRRDVLKTLAKDLESISTFTHEEELRLGPIPTIELISTITRAIHLNKTLECEYLSTSSGKSTKELVPHSLFDTGLHWYVRAFDKNKHRFADFVLSRILSAKALDRIPSNIELQTEDSEYNNMVSLVITPHKNLKYPETIEFDYDMNNGQLVKHVRGYLAGYLLRRWNVDCSATGSLEGDEYQLRLQNVEELTHVDSLYLAPSFNLGQ